jgi:hypothetical protein
MFRWLKILFSRRRFQYVPAWETPPEIRKKLRCAIAGIDPDTVREFQNGKTDAPFDRPGLESCSPMEIVNQRPSANMRDLK